MQTTDEPDVRAEDRLLKAGEVAKRYRISESTFRRLHARGGAPPAIRVGGQLRWRVRDVDEWLGGQTGDVSA